MRLGRIKYCTKPDCLSVSPSVRPVPPIFSEQKAAETSNLVETQRRTRVTRGTNLRFKGH